MCTRDQQLAGLELCPLCHLLGDTKSELIAHLESVQLVRAKGRLYVAYGHEIETFKRNHDLEACEQFGVFLRHALECNGAFDARKPTITLKQYNSIHKDYRGVWSGDNPNNRPDMAGRRSAFSGSLNAINPAIPYHGGTTMLFEGEDFIIEG